MSHRASDIQKIPPDRNMHTCSRRPKFPRHIRGLGLSGHEGNFSSHERGDGFFEKTETLTQYAGHHLMS
jgi:hypothetical protein